MKTCSRLRALGDHCIHTHTHSRSHKTVNPGNNESAHSPAHRHTHTYTHTHTHTGRTRGSPTQVQAIHSGSPPRLQSSAPHWRGRRCEAFCPGTGTSRPVPWFGEARRNHQPCIVPRTATATHTHTHSHTRTLKSLAGHQGQAQEFVRRRRCTMRALRQCRPRPRLL